MSTLKKRLVLPLVIGGCVLVVAFFAGRYWHAIQDPEYPDSRTVRYSFTLQNTSGRLLESADLWVFAPVRQTSWQKAGEVTASHPFERVEDGLGNQLLHFKFDNLPPFSTKIVSITAVIHLAERPQHTAEADLGRFLASEPYVEVEDAAISAVAARLAGNDARDSAHEALTWVSNNLSYSGYVAQDRGAAYALKKRSGDCTEYTYLYMALARAKGVPTRGIGGYLLQEDGVLNAQEFHNWAEVHMDGRWRVVDPQNGRFLERENEYVAMRVLSGKNESPISSHRFAYSGTGLVVKMN